MIVSVSDVVHGSMHDNKLFKQSSLPTLLNDNCRMLGDKGYMGNKHVMIPHKKRKRSELTSEQTGINKIHNTHRVVVENVFFSSDQAISHRWHNISGRKDRHSENISYC